MSEVLSDFTYSNFSAAILAGGKNSRFNGINKSFLKIENQFIIDRILAVLKNIFSEIIIVSNNPEVYADYNEIKIVSDFYKNIGPLGGIHAALKTAGNSSVFIVSCDMPFLCKEFIIRQINSHIKSGKDISIPQIDDFLEPLHGIYNRNTTEILENFINTAVNYKIINFYDFVSINYYKVYHSEIEVFTNINKPDDYQKYIDKPKIRKDFY